MTESPSSSHNPTGPTDSAVPAGKGPTPPLTAPTPPTPPTRGHGGSTEPDERLTDDPLDDAVIGTGGPRGADSPGGARDKATHVASTAKDEAASLASAAKDAAGSVLDTERSMARETTAETADRAKATLAEAKVQIKDLWQQSRGEISDGAGVQLQRLSAGARAVSDELDTMASASDDPGIASDLARRASGYLAAASEWLDNRGPEEVVTDVKRFARRSPGTFLAIAAGLGMVVGRVSRSLKDDSGEPTGSTNPTGTGGSAAPRAEHLAVPAPRTTPADDIPGFDVTGATGTTPVGETHTAGRVPASTLPGTPLDGGELR